MTDTRSGQRAGKLSGAFVPWLYSSSAAVRNVSLQDMSTDGAVMAAAVAECAHLFHSRAVSVNMDPTVWAEACGCDVSWTDGPPRVVGIGNASPDPDTVADSDRVQVVLEAVERSRASMPNDTIACGIAGPATLAGFLEIAQPPSASDQFTIGDVAGEAARLLCERQLDLLVVMESPSLKTADLEVWIQRGHYTRICNVAKHFEVETMLLSPGADLSTDSHPSLDSFDYIVSAASGTRSGAGPQMGIVLDEFGSGDCHPESSIEEMRKEESFLTTAWDIPIDADLVGLQRDMASIRAVLEA